MGPGGYGAILRYRGREKTFSAGYTRTTNNRMELMAAIVALEALKEHCEVILSTAMTRLAAKAGHLALYLLLFAIGISGYLISTADGKPISVFGWFDVPATLADAGAQADFAGALHFWLASRSGMHLLYRIFYPLRSPTGEGRHPFPDFPRL